MQLLFFIASDSDVVAPLLSKLMERDVHGATVVPCEGMLHALYDSTVEPPPLFGSLRHFLNPAHAQGKIVLLVLPDKKVETVKEVIHDMIGPLDGPNKGVLFTLPIAYSEGVAED